MKERMTLAQMAETSATTGGLQCPKCGCNHFEVYKTIRGESAKFRYKACRHCGHKILTSTLAVERIVRDVSGDDDE